MIFKLFTYATFISLLAGCGTEITRKLGEAPSPQSVLDDPAGDESPQPSETEQGVLPAAPEDGWVILTQGNDNLIPGDFVNCKIDEAKIELDSYQIFLSIGFQTSDEQIAVLQELQVSSDETSLVYEVLEADQGLDLFCFAEAIPFDSLDVLRGEESFFEETASTPVQNCSNSLTTSRETNSNIYRTNDIFLNPSSDIIARRDVEVRGICLRETVEPTAEETFAPGFDFGSQLF